MEAASEGSMMAAAAAAAATDSLSGGGASSAPMIPERLQQREAERRGEAERRRKEREAQSVEEERSEFFAAAFSRQREAAEALLGPGLGSEAVSEAAALLQELQRLLTDSVRFLAPYEVRQAQAALTRLQGALAQRRLDVQPKKRFAFSKALKKEASGKPSEATKEEGTEGPPSILLPSEPSCGFSQEEGKALELGQEELLQKDVVLSGLSRCRVRLKGNPNTLLLRDCQDCTLLCGPVSTSARVDGCQRCLVALACQQLRTRRTSDTSFYVQVTSRAMLEECRGIRFAPYTWSYRGQEQDFETSRLDRSQGHWDRVDDFDWLARDQASPNWSILPEKERVTDWD